MMKNIPELMEFLSRHLESLSKERVTATHDRKMEINAEIISFAIFILKNVDCANTIIRQVKDHLKDNPAAQGELLKSIEGLLSQEAES